MIDWPMVSVLFAVLLQVIFVAYHAGKLGTRLKCVEDNVLAIKRNMEDVDKLRDQNHTKVAVMEEKQNSLEKEIAYKEKRSEN